MELSSPYYAILIAAVVSFVVGGLWYSPLLFGNVWMKLMKIDPKEMGKNKSKANQSMAIMFLLTILTAYVFAHFLSFLPEKNLSNYLQMAFWIWLGFVMPVTAGSVLWESKPVKLFLINTSHQLVSLLLTALVLFLVS